MNKLKLSRIISRQLSDLIGENADAARQIRLAFVRGVINQLRISLKIKFTHYSGIRFVCENHIRFKIYGLFLGYLACGEKSAGRDNLRKYTNKSTP